MNAIYATHLSQNDLITPSVTCKRGRGVGGGVKKWVT